MSHIAMIGLGIAAGFHGALYGAYKDSPHESFIWRRFARDVVDNPAIRLLLGIGFLASIYGCYKSMTGPFREWYEHRNHFVVPYAATWLLYLLLCSHPRW